MSQCGMIECNMKNDADSSKIKGSGYSLGANIGMANMPNVFVKYHYMETLECRPGCEVYRVEIPGDRVGFIGVRNAPTDFEIVNP